MSVNGLLTTAEVARRLGCSLPTVKTLVAQGRLAPAVGKIGLSFVWEEAAVDAVEIARRPEGMLDIHQAADIFNLSPMAAQNHLPEPEAFHNGRGKPTRLWSRETVARAAAAYKERRPNRKPREHSGNGRGPWLGEQANIPTHHELHPGGWMGGASVPDNALLYLAVEEAEFADALSSYPSWTHDLAAEDCLHQELRQQHPQEYARLVMAGALDSHQHPDKPESLQRWLQRNEIPRVGGLVRRPNARRR